LQVLQPLFDPTFSDASYGFRPGRRAHDAVCRAQAYVQEGRSWVVDIDLEKFFDRVNHDILMSRLAKRIADRRVLRLIRRYLNAGVLANGVVIERHEGTPQGGTHEGARAGTDPAQCRTKSRADVQTARNVSVGLESLLPARGHATGARRHRWLGPSPPPGGATQTLEARPDYLSRARRPRDAFRSSRRVAANSRRWWHNSAMALNMALPNDLFKRLGVPKLAS
jgi:hypothetical protein